MKSRIPLSLCAAALGVSLVPAVAHADTAVLVGVNKYAKLPARNQLEGCVNDAESMAASLKAQGFTKVVMLTNEQATHNAVMQAIKNSGNKTGERFVFGFFGHGTNDGGRKAVILPADATMSGGAADIDAESLRDAVAAVPASSRTIILDSCFSGGMLRSVKDMKASIRTRFVARPNAKINFNANRKRGDSKDLTPVGDDPTPAPNVNGAPCYVVAAAQNQPACEDVFEGKQHGVFTATLTKRLNASGADMKTWGEVITDVRAEMDDLLEGTQKPEVSPSFAATKIFAGGGKADPTPAPPHKPDDLWDVYNADQRDPDAIQVSVSPDKTTIPMGARIDLGAKVGKADESSFLIVIEKGTSGNINLLYPRKPSILDAKVTENKTINLGGYKGNDTGSEAVRAILFHSRESAQLLLDAFKSGDGSDNDAGTTRKVYKLSRSAFRSALKKRDLSRLDGNTANFATADVTFEVVKGG